MTSLDITRAVELPHFTETNGPSTGAQNISRQLLEVGGNALPQQGQAEAREISSEELADAVDSIASYMQTMSRQLTFTIDDNTGNAVVTVLDRETEQVIRQIPSEEALAISQFIAEQLDDPVKGLLVQSEA